jgi:nucleoside phosphorylase
VTNPQVRVGVLVALREELQAIEPGLRRLPAACGRTGIGRASALAKTRVFLAERRPAALVVAGFGGGLREGFAAGDILVASEVRAEGPRGQAWPAPAELLAKALAVAVAGVRIVQGRLASVSSVLSSAADKRRVSAELDADVADMESAGALEAADEAGVPALCVRAVLDEHDFELPFDFGRILTPEGKPRLGEAAMAIVKNPAGLAKLLPLRARAQAAARSLELYVPRLVEALL